MYKPICFLMFVVICMAPAVVQGQDLPRRCGTPTPPEEERQAVQNRVALFTAANPEFQRLSLLSEIVIPVYFHVIHAGGKGNVSERDCDRQLTVLNDAYGPHRIRFTKAGYQAVDNEKWWYMSYGNPAEQEAKRTLQKDPRRHLNIYIGAPTTSNGDPLLGYATFPDWLAGDPVSDGVVLVFNSLPGGSGAPYNEGDTGVHEVGHWLGLYHTFQDGCDGVGDHVDDTPASASPTSGDCAQNEGRDTCPQPGKDLIENYMDYSDDSCMDSFTRGQVERMWTMLSIYRKNLAQRIEGPLERDSLFIPSDEKNRTILR